jgi:hypothetical protein
MFTSIFTSSMSDKCYYRTLSKDIHFIGLVLFRTEIIQRHKRLHQGLVRAALAQFI